MTGAEHCVSHSLQCATLFRLGRSVEAALDMLEVFTAVDAVMRQRSAADRQQWSQLLMNMLACQQADDWLGLADAMQYELVALLNA